MQLKYVILFLFCFITIIKVKSCPDSLIYHNKIIESIAQEYCAHCGIDYSKRKTDDSKFLLSVFSYNTDTIVCVTIVQKNEYPIYNPMGDIVKYPILEAKLDNELFTICIDETISKEYILDLFQAEVLNIDSLSQVEVPIMRYEAPEYTFAIRNGSKVEFVQDGYLHIPHPDVCLQNNWHEPTEDVIESLIIEE